MTTTTDATRISQAIAIAADVHLAQTDKSGEPYILHALAVMNGAMEIYDGLGTDGSFRADVICAAVLHDVVEDFEGDAIHRGALNSRLYRDFSGRTVSAIDALTHQRHETYDDYIGRVERDWIARIVKIADLTHNMDPRRLPSGEITQVDFDRWDKYRRALVRLREADTATRRDG